MLNDFDGALQDIKESEKISKENISLYNFFANYYRIINKPDLATKYMDKTFLLDKNNIRLIGTKAAIYSSVGDDENFYIYAERALLGGAKARWFYYDIQLKYKGEPRYIDLLKKYNQTTFI